MEAGGAAERGAVLGRSGQGDAGPNRAWWAVEPTFPGSGLPASPEHVAKVASDKAVPGGCDLGRKGRCSSPHKVSRAATPPQPSAACLRGNRPGPLS